MFCLTCRDGRRTFGVMDEVNFTDPPPKGQRPGGRMARFVAALSERPDEWAQYPIATTAGGLQYAKQAYPSCEWTTRKRQDGKLDMYARYIGVA